MLNLLIGFVKAYVIGMRKLCLTLYDALSIASRASLIMQNVNQLILKLTVHIGMICGTRKASSLSKELPNTVYKSPNLLYQKKLYNVLRTCLTKMLTMHTENWTFRLKYCRLTFFIFCYALSNSASSCLPFLSALCISIYNASYFFFSLSLSLSLSLSHTGFMWYNYIYASICLKVEIILHSGTAVLHLLCLEKFVWIIKLEILNSSGRYMFVLVLMWISC